jgi:UDP-glucose 4-epimerase
MTEEQIILLGFEKQVEEEVENPFYYYTLDIVDGLSFITMASDEVKDGEWIVEVFNTSSHIKFKDASILSNLIEILNQGKEDE